jgi:hypothetical protein
MKKLYFLSVLSISTLLARTDLSSATKQDPLPQLAQDSKTTQAENILIKAGETLQLAGSGSSSNASSSYSCAIIDGKKTVSSDTHSEKSNWKEFMRLDKAGNFVGFRRETYLSGKLIKVELSDFEGNITESWSAPQQ